MRTIAAILLVITITFVGFTAISESAQQTEGVAMNDSNASSDAWNLTDGVFSGVGQATSPALVYGGIGAIILVALGFLVAANPGGGR